ncbi:DUF7513 family protein [Natronorubrum aibiense]|uniref:TRAM domain-containing protein n=1 Tax=Natronorubrum aibiense TaxID=348826 RepID=A0A5P9NZ59_9EURY|nr:TRAM domain-containing protein [Natronorubrum aibiense]QFU81172.1 TRAM domain-containing protein [Natronorubrum aibiense]
MSLFTKYFKGWKLRTTTPSFDVGEEIDVFVAESNSDGDGHAYIGDTHLIIEGAGPQTVEKRVRVRITEFDETNATGRGDFVKVVGESSYTG